VLDGRRQPGRLPDDARFATTSRGATHNVRALLARKRSTGRGHPQTSIQFMRTPAVEAELAAIVDTWRPYLGRATSS
jgi:hypothetical protein